MTVRALAVAVAVMTTAQAATAAAAPTTFSGSCAISGPIAPSPPITLVPVSGAHFSYRGSGPCSGSLDGAAANGLTGVLTFKDASTLFDTCELGPDLDLHGTLAFGTDRRFDVTVDLVRAALTGPFRLTTPGGGLAYGLAQFAPADASAAPAECVAGGIGAASLSANFTTSQPLTGERIVVPAAAPVTASTPARVPVRKRKRHRRRHRCHRTHRRHRC